MKVLNTTRAALVIASLAIATFGGAQTTTNVSSGSTNVTLNAGFVSALTGLGVSPSPVYPSALSGYNINFPIVGGAADTTTLKGELFHSGGLTLTAGSTVVTLSNFVIDTTALQAVITGDLVEGGKLIERAPLFNVIPSGGPSIRSGYTPVITLGGVNLTLTSAAAGALNAAFSTSAIKANTAVGTAEVVAIAVPQATE